MIQTYGFVMLITALAATLQASTGFGFNLFAVPILVLFYPKEDLVPALHLVWVPLGVALWFHNRRHIGRERVFTWLIPALPCTVVGAWFLTYVDANVFSLFIGGVTIASVILIALNLLRPFQHEKPWLFAAGAASGFLGGATAMSGPPLLVLGLNQRWRAESFRADLLAYFLLLAIATLFVYAWKGIISGKSLYLAAAGLPGLIFGFFLGTFLARRIVGRGFRYVAMGMLCVVGVLPWWKWLYGFFSHS